MSPAKPGLQRRTGAAERHMHHLQSGELQEPGAGEVRALADAGRAIGQLVRIGLEVGDQFRDRLDPGRGMRRDDVRDPDHVGDRLQLLRLVGQVPEDAVGDRVGAGIADQDGVAVALAAHDFGRADGAAAAGAVFHDRRLAPGGLQMRRQQPPHHVGGAAGGRRHDQADGFGRPPVGAKARARQDRRGRDGGGAGQHAAAGKSLCVTSSLPAWILVLPGSVGRRGGPASRRLGAGETVLDAFYADRVGFA